MEKLLTRIYVLFYFSIKIRLKLGMETYFLCIQSIQYIQFFSRFWRQSWYLAQRQRQIHRDLSLKHDELEQ